MAESHAERVEAADSTALSPPRFRDLVLSLRLTVLPRLLAIALLIVFAAAAVALDFHHRATVNGHSVSVLKSVTAADCARRLKVPLQPGDLVDVSGHVLKAGAGAPALFHINGALASADERVRPGDMVTITPAGDLTEPLAQSAAFITPIALTRHGTRAMPWLTESGVGGIRYVRRGQISGKLHSVQMAALTPAHGTAFSGPRRVALTFDDGPHPTYTPQILNILADHHAHATFFILGVWAAKHPHLVRQAVAEGHEIGCHSWSHPDLTRLSSDAVRQQVRRWEQTVNPMLPTRARHLRPPYGAVNAGVRSLVREMGYTVVLWSGDTSDWRKPGSDAIYRRAMAAARDGANILMHDGGGQRHQTVAAVRRLVPDLQARGYQLVTLSELHDSTDPWDGHFIIHTDSGQLHLRPADPRMTVVINGKPVEMPVRPVEIEGQLLLPARPTLELLGSAVRYDKPSGRLYIDAPVYSLQMDLNRQMLQAGSEQVWMAVPPVLYRGHSMVPVWLLRQYCGVTATWDPTTNTLHLQSPHGRGSSALDCLPLRAASGVRLPAAGEGLVAVRL